MKRSNILLLTGLTIGIFACNSSTHRQEKTSEHVMADDSTSSLKLQNTNPGGEVEQDPGCARGKAEPVIQKDDYPNTSFILQADGLSAIEIVTFDTGDKLIIRNESCEYYVLSFRFETNQYQHDTTDLGFWYQAAHNLMTGLLGGMNAPMDIKRGLVALENYRLMDGKNDFKNLQLGEEIDFGGDDIRSYLILERIEKMSDKKYGVTISFFVGPL